MTYFGRLEFMTININAVLVKFVIKMKCELNRKLDIMFKCLLTIFKLYVTCWVKKKICNCFGLEATIFGFPCF